MKKSLAALLLLAGMLPAQEFRATISGRVSDAQNAAIGGVKITALQISTGTKTETISTSDGNYTLPFLQPANYRLSAEVSGFKRYVRELTASANERLGVDIQMEVGDVTETVTVTSESPVLETATASTGQVITSSQIENMPVSGRTPLA